MFSGHCIPVWLYTDKSFGQRFPEYWASTRRQTRSSIAGSGQELGGRFLGIDSAGREVLSYVDGEVAGRPRPPWIADETRLASIGRLVRGYDDAAASFVPSPDALAAVQVAAKRPGRRGTAALRLTQFGGKGPGHGGSGGAGSGGR